jgi:hypothetical protein
MANTSGLEMKYTIEKLAELGGFINYMTDEFLEGVLMFSRLSPQKLNEVQEHLENQLTELLSDAK